MTERRHKGLVSIRSEGPPDHELVGSFDGGQTEFGVEEVLNRVGEDVCLNRKPPEDKDCYNCANENDGFACQECLYDPMLTERRRDNFRPKIKLSKGVKNIMSEVLDKNLKDL